MSDYKLTNELLVLSEANTWDKAKLEWEPLEIEEANSPEECLCGHYPIKEICIIRNKKTNSQARVGNCCVKKFIDNSGKIFSAIKKIQKDNTKSINAETLEFALKKEIVSRKDYDFYFHILRKRNLTTPQLKWKQDINNKIKRSVIKK